MHSGLEYTCDPQTRQKKRFTFYNSRRDRAIEEKPRIRSIPNPIKRFLFELKNPSIFETVGNRRSNESPRGARFQSQSMNSSMSETESPRVVETDLYSITAKKNRKNRIKGRTCSSLTCNVSTRNCVMRCVLCDYPYEPEKRRKPPHPYLPGCVPMRNARDVGTMGLSRVAPGYLNIPGQKKAKVTRLKRRRSSTELYKGLVAVSTE